MIVGRISGKITTNEFCFQVDGNPKKFDYVQVMHRDYGFVLCQIVEIERNSSTTARCSIIGYKDKDGRIRQIRTPFEQDTEVLQAEDSFIRSVIMLDDTDRSAYLGFLEGKRIPVYVRLNTLLTKHVAVLAKSGAGKSYTVGVLLEEIMEKKVPLLILDPHGEYSDLRYPTEEDASKLRKFGIRPKGYAARIREYGDPEINPEHKPLRLPNVMTPHELLHLMPAKLSAAQQNVLFSAIKNIDRLDFLTLMQTLELEENNAKYSVINVIDYLDKLSIFSENPTPYQELVRPGQCTIINLKGTEPMVQEMIAYKLLSDLFELRKKELVAPFFTVIEEAHMFCPERSFGETKASKILRTIASEGRKFGQGLCIVSQRPARVDKSVLSQCSTQLILKVTNPNDLKAIGNSVEGITSEAEKEIVNLPIGSAIVTGVVDVPLFVSIRPRRSKHGGEAVDMLSADEDFLDDVKEYEKKEILPVILPRLSRREMMLMEGSGKLIRTYLYPGAMLLCNAGQSDFHLLADLYHGAIVHKEKLQYIPSFDSLSGSELLALKKIFALKRAMPDDLKGITSMPKAIEALKELDYIRWENGYVLNDAFVFTSLENRQTNARIQFKPVAYTKKMEKRHTAQEMQEKISEFAAVKDSHECFIVRHEREE